MNKFGVNLCKMARLVKINMKSFPDPKKNSFTISMDKKAAKNSKKDAILPSASLLYGGSL